MKRFTAIMLLAAASAYAQGDPPELAQLKQRATVMQALSEISPIAVTNQAPFTARLDAAANRLRKTDWAQVRQELPKVPASASDVAAALRETVRAPTYLMTEFQGYYILSDVGISEPSSALPLDNDAELKAKLAHLLLSDPDAFMSGFAVPKGTAKWMKFDFRKTYTLTPKGVKIERNTIAEPESGHVRK